MINSLAAADAAFFASQGYTDPVSTAAQYGAVVSDNNSVEETAALRESVDHSFVVDFGDRDLVKILRLRLLTERGYPMMDISYCYGELRDGTRVRVNFPDSRLPRNWKGQILAWAKEAGVYAKSTGIFENVSILWG